MKTPGPTNGFRSFFYFCNQIGTTMILSARQLIIGYDGQPIQQPLDLEVQAGEMICILGSNGCGKSTLLRTLAGLQDKLGGSLTIQGKNADKLNDTDKAKLFSLVLTDKVELENTTVFEMVALGRYPHSSWLGGLSEADKKAITKSIEMVRLTDKSECFFNCLSDGEKQRVMIAKALAQDTPLILLDEPTAHLDLPNRVKIMLLLRQLAHDTRRSVLISSHELDLALQTADKIWLMQPQKGICCGTPDELVRQGIFQQAFQTDVFSFHYIDNRLVISYDL